MEPIKLINVAPDNSDLAGLIRNLDQYLAELFPADEIFLIDFNDPSIDKTFFVVAYLSDRPVGCGAIRPLNEKEVELKRFYVEPAYRRNGIANQILAYLENKARGLNFKAIRLETGDKQTEAIHFYKKHGYDEIDRFGEYIDCQSSRCFEKKFD
ncbi:GNAT family N-acetyltransferase [Paenibacillus sp. sgz302251]|uniref:GNAT family N-acetyltransferase n=1 Tax=Paenibacillus sp. sgz302251 TaxID=3414493 RepID=UPI003C7BD2B3